MIRRSRFQISISAPFAIGIAFSMASLSLENHNLRNTSKMTVRADGENTIFSHCCSSLTGSWFALQYDLFARGTEQNGSHFSGMWMISAATLISRPASPQK